MKVGPLKGIRCPLTKPKKRHALYAPMPKIKKRFVLPETVAAGDMMFVSYDPAVDRKITVSDLAASLSKAACAARESAAAMTGLGLNALRAQSALESIGGSMNVAIGYQAGGDIRRKVADAYGIPSSLVGDPKTEFFDHLTKGPSTDQRNISKGDFSEPIDPAARKGEYVLYVGSGPSEAEAKWDRIGIVRDMQMNGFAMT